MNYKKTRLNIESEATCAYITMTETARVSDLHRSDIRHKMSRMLILASIWTSISVVNIIKQWTWLIQCCDCKNFSYKRRILSRSPDHKLVVLRLAQMWCVLHFAFLQLLTRLQGNLSHVSKQSLNYRWEHLKVKHLQWAAHVLATKVVMGTRKKCKKKRWRQLPSDNLISHLIS